ncbi:glutamine amidotransferase [Acinetobacter equi]|uniref:Glutamine amidotransferase n=1 Tax=Acinetobacter equi TaxID=1324350 RepID=A0A0N9W2W3_9GAMM|nr:glutamine amidotransferase [Acinetobacter equi]ALH95953.1 glutamine amidotransferase [Acinetobacter equi]
MLNLDHLPDIVYAIQHVSFEDLGSLEDTFYQLGFRVRYFEAGVDDLKKAFEYKGLTIILGGPVGVNEIQDYPFLQSEIDLLKVRLEKHLPTLGICLGAQLIASALGSKVFAGHTKEIGWSKLQLESTENNLLSPLSNIPVLHWHGDTFDLPDHTILLASTEHYPNQAFQLGTNILALQFHIEVEADALEKWLIGHTTELRQAQIDIQKLRQDNQIYAPALTSPTKQIIENFMKKIII